MLHGLNRRLHIAYPDRSQWHPVSQQNSLIYMAMCALKHRRYCRNEEAASGDCENVCRRPILPLFSFSHPLSKFSCASIDVVPFTAVFLLLRPILSRRSHPISHAHDPQTHGNLRSSLRRGCSPAREQPRPLHAIPHQNRERVVPWKVTFK